MHSASLSVEQPVAEKPVNRHLVDFLDGDFDVILDAAIGDCSRFVVPDGVTGPLIVVSRLADRTDIDHGLESRFDGVNHVHIGGSVKFAVFGENAGDMGVSLKRAVRHNVEKAVHFSLVEDIFLKNVLIERVAGAAVDKEKVVHPIGAGQGSEKIPAGVRLGVVEILKLVPRPENRLFRPDVEAFRVEKRCLIVISEQADLGFFHHQIDALQRIGTVTDRIAETKNLVRPLQLNVFQHRVQGFEVTVNVTDDGTSQ